VLQFDPTKDAENRRKHRIGLARFADMRAIFIVPDPTHSAVEARYAAYGVIEGRVYQAVLTYRGTDERVISLRPASRRERRLYEASQK
jgi:hypothetical protein